MVKALSSRVVQGDKHLHVTLIATQVVCI